MNSLRTDIINKHRAYYNNCKLVNFNDQENSGLEYYSLNDLQNIDKDWFPLGCVKDKQTNKLLYGGKSKIYHTYVEGETGCGKTTRVVIQSLTALSHMKNKPSFIVIDPFGELCENTYNNYKKLGYNIKIFNCDNPSLSDTYNPFDCLCDEVIDKGCITNNVENKTHKIAKIIVPVKSEKDPIWEMGAGSYLSGLMLDLLEDLKDGKVKKENINFYNIAQRHYWLRDQILQNGDRDILQIDNYAKKGITSPSIQKMMAVTNNAEKTRDSYFGVLENCLDDFCQKNVYQLSSNSTIDIKQILTTPTVVFIQTGSTSVGENLASILIDDLYNYIEQKARQSLNKKLSRNVHIFFDEFANYNFGTGENFIRMLTTSRKFGMYWHMYLQCDAQLDNKYKSVEIGNIIRANATEVFMGSQDYKTIQRFSESCGQQTIESLQSKLFPENPILETVPLVSESNLMEIKEGFMYVKINKNPLLLSYFEPFYICDEFTKVDNILNIYPNNKYDYEKTLKLPYEEKNINYNNNPFYEYSNKNDLDYRIINSLTYVTTDSGNDIIVANVPLETAKQLVENDYVGDNYLSEDDLEIVCDRFELEEKYSVTKFYMDYIDDENTYYYVKQLEELSCVPTEMIEAMSTPLSSDFEFNSVDFEDDIIVKYIKENNFNKKVMYDNKFKKEIEKIKTYTFLPNEVIDCFIKANEKFCKYNLDYINTLKSLMD